jgi:hypothetical protein
MKKPAWFMLLIVLLFGLMGCSFSQITDGVLAKSTDTPTPLPTNTSTPSATATAIPPTSTPKPTNTPKPTQVPKVTLAEFEAALRDAGYASVSYTDGSGNRWTLDNPFENTYTANDGQIQMDVLNSVKSRLSHMEEKFTVMDGLFSADFMAQLRKENETYAGTVGAGVTGKATNPYGPVPGDFWQYRSAFYNISDSTIGVYDVRFALFFQQWTCPAEYICTFTNFGNHQFSGQASFVFYEVMIWLEK